MVNIIIKTIRFKQKLGSKLILALHKFDNIALDVIGDKKVYWLDQCARNSLEARLDKI